MKLKLSPKSWLAGTLLALGLVLAPAGLAPVNVSAKCSGVNCVNQGANNARTGATSIDQVIKNVTNVLLFLVGAVSVIMLVLGGFKYVASNGNADQIKSAKNTILYAVIGLVVAIIAYAVVDFVVDAIV